MAGLWGVQYAKDDRQTLRHLAEVMVRSPYFDLMKFFFKLLFHNTADHPLPMSDFTFPLFLRETAHCVSLNQDFKMQLTKSKLYCHLIL